LLPFNQFWFKNQKQLNMATEIITTDDLREFKIELLEEIRQLFKEHNGEPSKKWLKSYEVRKILNISPGTLQNLRLNGTLPYTKIGGVMYYDYADIQEMLQSRKQAQPNLFSNR
jgi:hypothetical protein